MLALAALFRRFAPGLALPLVALTVLSPALLPGLNLMLDVPALALSLTAVVLFLNGCDRQSWLVVLASGLLAGLAMQTKYSGFVTPGVFLAYGLTRPPFALRRGGRRAGLGDLRWLGMLRGLAAWGIALPGRPGPAQRCDPRPAAASGAGAGYHDGRSGSGGVADRPGRADAFLARGSDGSDGAPARLRTFGMVAGAILAANRRDSLWDPGSGALGLPRGHWLAIGARWQRRRLVSRAVAATGNRGVFRAESLSAARRLLGVVVVATLLAGRLAVRSPDRHRRLVRLAALVSSVLGLGVALVDWREAAAAQEATEQAAQFVSATPGSTWLHATWGVQFYGCRAGMQSLTPGQSLLHRGDLLVVAEQQLIRPDLQLGQAPLQHLHTVTHTDGVPFRTVLCYYSGGTVVQRHTGPRLRLLVYRVLADFVPAQHGELAAGPGQEH